jgi:hypothetical protein
MKLIVDFLNFSNAPKNCTGDAPGLHINADRPINAVLKRTMLYADTGGSSDAGATVAVVMLICSIKK